MSIAVSRLLRLALMVVAVIGVGAAVASAATVTTPASSPFVVPGDAAGNPQPFTVQASGFVPGTTIFITQCDGVAPSDPAWTVGLDCDFGSAPGGVTADPSGVATFSGAHQFVPFKSASDVQGKFNCLGPADPPSGNGAPDWTNCRLRVSTNNTVVTADQAFLVLTMPNAATGSVTTTTATPTSTTTTPPTTVPVTTTTIPRTTTSTQRATTSTIRTTTTTSPSCTTTTSAAVTTTTSSPRCTTTTTFHVSGSTDPTTIDVSANSAGGLPRTGSSPLLPAAGVGVVLIGTGLAIAVSRRRRAA
jgi:LPXTG-motif cell wall-anchored protein